MRLTASTPNGSMHEIRCVYRTNLGHDVVSVARSSFEADSQICRNLLCASPGDDQVKDFLLPLGEGFDTSGEGFHTSDPFSSDYTRQGSRFRRKIQRRAYGGHVRRRSKKAEEILGNAGGDILLATPVRGGRIHTAVQGILTTLADFARS